MSTTGQSDHDIRAFCSDVGVLGRRGKEGQAFGDLRARGEPQKEISGAHVQNKAYEKRSETRVILQGGFLVHFIRTFPVTDAGSTA